MTCDGQATITDSTMLSRRRPRRAPRRACPPRSQPFQTQIAKTIALDLTPVRQELPRRRRCADIARGKRTSRTRIARSGRKLRRDERKPPPAKIPSTCKRPRRSNGRSGAPAGIDSSTSRAAKRVFQNNACVHDTHNRNRTASRVQVRRRRRCRARKRSADHARQPPPRRSASRRGGRVHRQREHGQWRG